MENNQNSNLNIHSENAVALPSEGLSYGMASTIQYTEYAEANVLRPASLTFTDQINFFFSEYFKGFFFVVLTSLFILAMPKTLVKQGSLRGSIYLAIKRSLDITGALVGLLLTLPLWIVFPLLIKLTSSGPVFYTQKRIGINRRRSGRRAYQRADISERRERERRRVDYKGKPFDVVKFRTMVQDAEKSTGPVWATANDPRVTKIGLFMRKTRIDEIPQFLNVLMGDMSLVGPRPERPTFVLDLSTKVSGYADRLQVKPGITGMAQVENGYDSSVDSVVRKVQYDMNYIENQSLWLDLKIILKTVKVVFTGKGAH